MKKLSIKTIFCAGLLLFGFSCTKVDNYPGPDSSFQGNLIDSVTGKNMVTESQGFNIELKQLNWSDNPDPYYIPAKLDGTFQDTRIFGGHYSVIPTQGPFWPTDSIVTDIKGATSHDFTVVPYLEVTDFTHVQAGDSLVMTCRISAPRTVGLPQILEVWPFVNNTPFVGSGAYISQYTISDHNSPSYNLADINSSWNSGIGTATYEVHVRGLLNGRTYYVRMGVRVNDNYKKFNLSEVAQVVMPPEK
jgi:hypothetical protein